MTGSPTDWEPPPACTNIDHQGRVDWGAALLEDGGDWYIFGFRRHSDPEALPGTGTVVLARTDNIESLDDFGAWKFLYKNPLGGSMWVSGPGAAPVTEGDEDQLYVVANQPMPQFTVTKVSFSNVTRYVMVQGVPELYGRDVMLRVGRATASGSPLMEWDDVVLGDPVAQPPTVTESDGSTCIVNMASTGSQPNGQPFDPQL